MFYVTDLKALFRRVKWLELTVGCVVEVIIRMLLRSEIMPYRIMEICETLLLPLNEECTLFPVVSVFLFLIFWCVEKILDRIEQDFIGLDKELRALRDAQHTDKNH